MKLEQDLHLHSHHSCDSACAVLRDIRKDREAAGIREYALTDHYHTRYNFSDIESARHDFLGGNFPPNFHFSIEITCMCAWECEKIAAGDYQAAGDEPIYGFRHDERPFDGRLCLDITREELRKLGIEFVVAGVHWPAGLPKTRNEAIDNYFQQHMFLASHPLADVVAHPWWSIEHAAGDWFRHRDAAHIDWEVYRHIPLSLIDQLGEEIRRNGKFAEINTSLLAGDPEFVMDIRLQWYQRWREAGVKFTAGSDQHKPHFPAEIYQQAEEKLTRCGFTEADFGAPWIR